MTTKEESWVLVLVGAVLLIVTMFVPIDRMFLIHQGIFLWFGFGILLTGFLTLADSKK